LQQGVSQIKLRPVSTIQRGTVKDNYILTW